MQPHRKKPLTTHVRTGCITCKRRRVKCPEEHPHCSRCIRGGFICAGYAVPKAWIFEGSARTPSEIASGNDKRSQEHSSPENIEAMSSGLRRIDTPVRERMTTPLQLGNSDPFNAYAIPIGPQENYLFATYLACMESSFPQPSPSRSKTRIPYTTAYCLGYYVKCLKDQAAAYGLLARNAAVIGLMRDDAMVADTTAILSYVTRSQASLQKKLSLLDSFETPEMVSSIMWTTTFLAGTELMMGLPSARHHVKAMRRMVTRYLEIAHHPLDIDNLIYPLWVDVVYGLVSMSRPFLISNKLITHHFHRLWTIATTRCTGVVNGTPSASMHEDVQDPFLQTVILSERGLLAQIGHKMPSSELSFGEELLLVNAMGGQSLVNHGELLNAVIDTIEARTSGNLSLQATREQLAKAYLALSTMIWMQSKLQRTPALRIHGYNLPFLLENLKQTISKDIPSSTHRPDSFEQFAVARLWALFIGAHAESQRRSILGVDFVCGTWFFEALRDQAASMQLRSWQDAVPVLAQVLYNDRLIPHISDWWPQTLSGQSHMLVERTNLPIPMLNEPG